MGQREVVQDVAVGPFGPWRESFKESGDIVDGIVGVRGRTALSDKWYMNYLADIGAGGSDLTRQALVGLNYRFSKVNAAFGYRYLTWERNNNTFDDLDLSGPYAGDKVQFRTACPLIPQCNLRRVRSRGKRELQRSASAPGKLRDASSDARMSTALAAASRRLLTSSF